MTTHAIQLAVPLNAAHLHIIPLQSSSVTSYFGVYFLSIAEYENEEILMIHLTTEEPPWDPLTNEYLE